jgi:hypothetical protein
VDQVQESVDHAGPIYHGPSVDGQLELTRGRPMAGWLGDGGERAVVFGVPVRVSLDLRDR